MAGPTDLANEKFVEALRRAKDKSNSFQWLGKLYDDAPEIYREASPTLAAIATALVRSGATLGPFPHATTAVVAEFHQRMHRVDP